MKPARVPKHVPHTSSLFNSGYSRTANLRPQRWVLGRHLKGHEKTLTQFRSARRLILSEARKVLPKPFVIIHHSIWPRSYGYEYMVYVREED